MQGPSEAVGGRETASTNQGAGSRQNPGLHGKRKLRPNKAREAAAAVWQLWGIEGDRAR